MVEALARSGNELAFSFPVPMKGRAGCDFSFSGLKTAVRLAISELGEVSELQKADVCASFQRAACECILDRTQHALALFKKKYPHGVSMVLSGGVAANLYIRTQLDSLVRQGGISLIAPPPALCTDNAAMIAWAGVERLRLGLQDGLDFEPRARWPLARFNEMA
jgi:N6-L-threonylcarbamoyladenine synthase